MLTSRLTVLDRVPDMQVTSLHTALPARPHAASVCQELAARELAALGSRARSGGEGKPEPEKFPRYLLITGAVVEPLDHVAE